MEVDLAKLRAPFPKDAIKQRKGGGGRTFDYVETHTVIHRLNSACPSWDFRLTRFEQVKDVYIATGELTIPGLGTRTGIGVQRVDERAGEDLVKGASSDALKKAATLFGVALELYGPDFASEAPQVPVEPRKPQSGSSAPTKLSSAAGGADRPPTWCDECGAHTRKETQSSKTGAWAWACQTNLSHPWEVIE